MDESILNSIKRMLDIDPNYTVFDSVIMIHINSALSTLHQLGVGPSNGYAVSDADSTWNNLLSGNKLLNSVKSYIFISVKMVLILRQIRLQSMLFKNKKLNWNGV